MNNHAHFVTGTERADTRFLCYALAVTEISGYLTGSAMPKITQRAMIAIEVPLPPIDTQHAIAETLGSLDDKIEQNRRTGAKLEGLIDFDNPANNDFLVVRQLTVHGPSGKTIRTDLILYVNGLPLVIIELKDPANATATLDMAIDQFTPTLSRRTERGQRDKAAWCGIRRGRARA